MGKRRIAGSRTAVWRFFSRREISLKKACAQRSKRAPTWPGHAGAGSDDKAFLTRPRWSSSTRPQAKQHSAYRSPSVIIEYRWHPLHGKELHVCRRSGRVGTEMLEVEASPGVSRKLPAWMCDANTCSSMSLGPALVTISALNELRVVLVGQLSNRPDGASSNSSGKEESLDATSNKRSVKATGACVSRSIRDARRFSTSRRRCFRRWSICYWRRAE
jgi:hypothetical protein